MPIFNGKDLNAWQGIGGDTSSYYAQDGQFICKDTGKVHIFTTLSGSNLLLPRRSAEKSACQTHRDSPSLSQPIWLVRHDG